MKNVKRVGFDFDKIFVNYPPLIPDFLINYLYKKSTKKLKYRFPGKFEQKVRIASHLTYLRPPIKNNVKSLKKLGKNFEAYLVSSRFSFLQDRTNAWFEKNPIKKYFKKIYFNFKDEEPQIFKDRIIKKEKIQYFIDDDLDLLLYLSGKNPNVDFFWVSKNTPQSKLPKNVKKITTIDEFLNKYL